MSILNRKLRRDLYHSKGLLLAIILILGLGISAYVANLSLYLNLELSRGNYYARCRMADFWIDIQKLPLSEMDRLNEVPGVSELRSRIVMPVTIDLEDVVKPLTGLLVSMPDTPQPVINGFLMQDGSYFSDIRREEVILNHAFAEERGIRAGQTLHVILNDRRQELFVVGTAISSEFVFARAPGAMIPDKAGYAQLYVKRSFAEEAADLKGAANQLCGLLVPEQRQHPRNVVRAMEILLEPFGEAISTTLDEQDSNQQLQSDIRQIRTVNLIVPTVFLCVSALILDVLMLRLAQQQRTIIGTLKALGYSDYQLVVHFVKFGVVVGLLGGLAGGAFGFWLVGALLGLFQEFYELPDMLNRPYPLIVAACIGLSVVVASLGTLRGVAHVMRLKPAEAMRPQAPPPTSEMLLERLRVIWDRLDFRWQMVLRGITRHRIRTFTNIFSATMGTALILQTLQVKDALDELIDFTFERMLVSDFDLSLKDEVGYDGFLEASRLEGVDYAEPVLTVGCTFYNGYRAKRGGITGIVPQAQLTVPRGTDYQPLTIPSSGIVLSKTLAEKLRVSAGDQITVVPTDGERRHLQAPVSMIIESYVGMAAYANFDYLNGLVGEEHSLNAVQMRVNPAPDVMRRFYGQLKRIPKMEGYSAIREQKSQLVELLKPINTVNTLLITFAGLLCCGSITTASLISITERRQEIATFRVLGYQPAQIGAIFLRETLLVNSVGILLGLPVGYWFSWFIVQAVATDITRLPFVIAEATWSQTVLLGLAFTLVGNLPVYRAIRKLDWKDALNVKE